MATSQKIGNLYHFTDRRNLPSIREHDGLYSYARLVEMGIKTPAPGGNDWSHDADKGSGMDRFVHLCFRDNHPMVYHAIKDGRIESVIYLRIDAKVLEIGSVKFTAEVSNKSAVEPCSLKEAMKLIDFDMLYGPRKNWGDPEIQARLQAVEKYEILVPDHIPLDLILNLPNG